MYVCILFFVNFCFLISVREYPNNVCDLLCLEYSLLIPDTSAAYEFLLQLVFFAASYFGNEKDFSQGLRDINWDNSCNGQCSYHHKG